MRTHMYQKEDEDILKHWEEVNRVQDAKTRARANQWQNTYEINKSNVQLRDNKKNRIKELDIYEEKDTQYHDNQLKKRLDQREFIRKKEAENTANMNVSRANFRKIKNDNQDYRQKVGDVMAVEHPDPFQKNQANYRKYLSDVDRMNNARVNVYKSQVLPSIARAPTEQTDQKNGHNKALSMSMEIDKMHKDRLGDPSNISPNRPHVAGPYYVPYLDTNKPRVLEEMEKKCQNYENEDDRKKVEDHEYRKRINLELKQYEETQIKQKMALQQSMKDSQDKQIQEKQFFKDNAFRMTRREKNLNRPDLQNWKTNKPELEGQAIPGWGYNSRYKYLYLHNGYKKNSNSQNFPLGGDLYRSVQGNVTDELNKIEHNNRDSNDAAFIRLAEHKVSTQEAKMSNIGLANKDGNPITSPKVEATTNQNLLSQSQPNLLSTSEVKNNLNQDPCQENTAPPGYMTSQMHMDQDQAREFSHGIENAYRERPILQNNDNTNFSHRRNLY